MVSDAQKRARDKYDAEHYDRITFKAPRGTPARVRATAAREGLSTAAYMVRATLTALESAEPRNDT